MRGGGWPGRAPAGPQAHDMDGKVSIRRPLSDLMVSGMDNLSSFNYCNSDEFKFPIYTTCYIVTFVVGFISNMVALYVFLRLSCKTPSCVFMTNLAISDLLFTLTLPLRITYYLRRGDWIFGDPLCGIANFAFYVNMYTSISFLTVVSISRYVAILHPMNSRSIFSLKRCMAISLAIWTVVSLTSSPFLLAKSFQLNGTTRCFEPQNKPSLNRVLIMNYSALILGFFLPFLAITVCYVRIIRQLRGVQKELDGCGPRRGRSVALVTVVLTVFLFCFFPYHIVRTVHLHFAASQSHDCTVTFLMQKIVVLTLCMAASNSCFNPLLYYFAGASFRRALRQSLRRNSFVTYRRSVQHSTLEAPPRQ